MYLYYYIYISDYDRFICISSGWGTSWSFEATVKNRFINLTPLFSAVCFHGSRVPRYKEAMVYYVINFILSTVIHNSTIFIFQSFFPSYDRKWSATVRQVREQNGLSPTVDVSWEKALLERLHPSGQAVDLMPVCFY